MTHFVNIKKEDVYTNLVHIYLHFSSIYKPSSYINKISKMPQAGKRRRRHFA